MRFVSLSSFLTKNNSLTKYLFSSRVHFDCVKCQFVEKCGRLANVLFGGGEGSDFVERVAEAAVERLQQPVEMKCKFRFDKAHFANAKRECCFGKPGKSRTCLKNKKRKKTNNQTNSKNKLYSLYEIKNYSKQVLTKRV
jgi:hypothetical protein